MMARRVKIDRFRVPNKATARVPGKANSLAGDEGLDDQDSEPQTDLLIELSYGIIMVCLTPATGIGKETKFCANDSFIAHGCAQATVLPRRSD
jgi:hypothetical protein